MCCHPVAVVILHVYRIRSWLLLNLSREGYMRSMQQQLGVLGTISALAYRHRETKKHLCRSGRSQDLPDTDFYCQLRESQREHKNTLSQEGSRRGTFMLVYLPLLFVFKGLNMFSKIINMEEYQDVILSSQPGRKNAVKKKRFIREFCRNHRTKSKVFHPEAFGTYL